jgi:DNA-binding transcriptional MerR regulator
VTGTGDEARRWSIGELARATGLTVRTLHHYDQIGLVRPSERTWSGHRRYVEADVRRLYRVRALRSLGLSLEQIGRALEEVGEDLAALNRVLASQLEHLDAEAARLDKLRHQLRSLLERVSASMAPDPEEILNVLETMTMIEGYYSEEQLAYLARRREELGEDAIKAAEAEWPKLIAKMTEHQQAGTPVDDPEVAALARRWAELVAAFHGGDQGVRESLGRLWSERAEELNAQYNTGINAELMGYVQRAQEAAGVQM